MNNFLSTNTNHTFKVIPRFEVNNCSIILTHELTQTKNVLNNLNCFVQNGYLYVNFDFNFIANGSYYVEVWNQNIIWKGKIKIDE